MALSDQIIGAESGGDPNAQNPNSSAAGPGQFINSTWLDLVKQNRPDLAAGKSDAELLSLRNDPVLSGQMVDAYASINSKALTNAGFSPTPGNLYLAHFAGTQGGPRILSADPGASAAAILGPAALKANPFLRNMTAGDLISWAARRVSSSASASASASPPPAGAAVASAAPAPPLSQLAAPTSSSSDLGQLDSEMAALAASTAQQDQLQ